MSNITLEKMKASHLITLLITLTLISCKNNTSQLAKKSVGKIVTTNKKSTSKPPNKVIKPSKSFNHIEHIRDNSRKGETDGIPAQPEYFVDYVIQNLLEKPEHKKYITDRNLLRKLHNDICAADDYVLISDTLSNGDECEIEIKLKKFVPKDYTIKYIEEKEFIEEIDGKRPYGAVYGQPKTALKFLKIKINHKYIYTKIDKYNNLYDLELCNFGGFQKTTEAYEDGNNIYIYIFGGNAADSYFAKLVFHKFSGYTTSIITDYGPLSMYGSFGEHFIGY